MAPPSMRVMTSAMSACTALMAPPMLPVVSTTNRMSALAGGLVCACTAGVGAHARSAATAAAASNRLLTVTPLRWSWTVAADLASRPPGPLSALRRSDCRIRDNASLRVEFTADCGATHMHWPILDGLDEEEAQRVLATARRRR